MYANDLSPWAQTNPKLSELYNKLYPHEPMDISKLHNALYDVEITYKCYMKMMTLLSIE